MYRHILGDRYSKELSLQIVLKPVIAARKVIDSKNFGNAKSKSTVEEIHCSDRYVSMRSAKPTHSQKQVDGQTSRCISGGVSATTHRKVTFAVVGSTRPSSPAYSNFSVRFAGRKCSDTAITGLSFYAASLNSFRLIFYLPSKDTYSAFNHYLQAVFFSFSARAFSARMGKSFLAEIRKLATRCVFGIFPFLTRNPEQL